MADFVGDSIYDQIVIGAKARLTAAQTQAAEDTDRLAFNYGYGDKGAANQYSQLAVMKRQQGQDTIDQRNASAATGNARSGGAMIRATNLAFDQNRQSNTLAQQYQDAVVNNQRALLQQQFAYNDTTNNAYGDALQRQLARTTGTPEQDAPDPANPAAPTQVQGTLVPNSGEKTVYPIKPKKGKKKSSGIKVVSGWAPMKTKTTPLGKAIAGGR